MTEDLFRHAGKKYGANEALTPVRNQHFLRRDFPIVMTPHTYFDIPVATREKRTVLTMISKVAQNAANNVPFGTKEQAMTIFNPTLETLQSTIGEMSDTLMPESMAAVRFKNMNPSDQGQYKFTEFLADKPLFNNMKVFFEKQHTGEVFNFVESLEKAEGLKEKELKAHYESVIDTFLTQGGEEEVNISGNGKKAAAALRRELDSLLPDVQAINERLLAVVIEDSSFNQMWADMKMNYINNS